jgi:hypothetical protein
MANVQQTPSKEDSKPAAQPEDEESPLSAEQPRNRLRKQYHESEHMKKLFRDLFRDNQKQFKERGEKHTMEIAALKRANLDTQNLLTTKTNPAQTMIDHISTAHFNGNPTISWNQDITNYQPNENSEPFNFL